jgi:hypothetical protein
VRGRKWEGDGEGEKSGASLLSFVVAPILMLHCTFFNEYSSIP